MRPPPVCWKWSSFVLEKQPNQRNENVHVLLLWSEWVTATGRTTGNLFPPALTFTASRRVNLAETNRTRQKTNDDSNGFLLRFCSYFHGGRSLIRRAANLCPGMHHSKTNYLVPTQDKGGQHGFSCLWVCARVSVTKTSREPQNQFSWNAQKVITGSTFTASELLEPTQFKMVSATN